MIILALEFSSARRSVAVAEQKAGERDVQILGSVSDEAIRGAAPLVLVAKALDAAKVKREAVDGLVAGVGPGSYTGIRSAIALAQGWRLARGVPLRGISSVECIAYQVQACGCYGRIGIVIDAQRNEFYRAIYEVGPDERTVVEPLRLVRATESTALRPGEKLMPVGPDVARWFAEGQVFYPEASSLAALAALDRTWVGEENLEPIYLRETTFVKAPPLRVIPES